jgi:hypothetical protein
VGAVDLVAAWEAQDIADGIAGTWEDFLDPEATTPADGPTMEHLDRLVCVRRAMRAANPAVGTTWQVWKAALWALGDHSRGSELTEREVDAALWALDNATAKPPVFEPDGPIDYEALDMCRVIATSIRRRYT